MCAPRRCTRWRLHLALAALLGATTLVACADDAGSRRADDVGDDARVVFPDCHYEVDDVASGTIEGAATFDVAPTFALDGGRVVLHRRGTANASPDDLELVSVDPATGEERVLTVNASDDFLLDSVGGALLYASSTPDGRTLVLDRGDGPTVVDNVDYFTPFYQDGRRIRLLSEEAAGWLGFRSGDPSGPWHSAVRFHVDGAVYDLSDGLDSVQLPDVYGRAVAFAGVVDQQWQVYYATVENSAVHRRQLTQGDTPIVAPMLGDGAAYWIEGGRPQRYDLEADRVETLGELDCAMLDVVGERAVFVCSVEPQTSDSWPPRGNGVWLWDGQHLERVAQTEDAIYTVALQEGEPGGHTVAWVTYGAVNEPFEIGTVWVLWLDDAAGEPVVVSEISSGCWYCDAYWPPVALRFEGPLLVWNYALPEPDNDPWERLSSIGYAYVGAGLVCAGQ